MQNKSIQEQLKQWHQRTKPAQNAGIFARLVGWLLMGLMLLVGLTIGIILLVVGWILLLPLMWRRRRQMKQMWRFTRDAQHAQQQQQRQARQQKQHAEDAAKGNTIEGEYEVKEDR